LMGFHNWCTINTKKVYIIPPGYNAEIWKSDEIERDIDFLTVGIVSTESGYYRKGLDKFIEMAGKMPNFKFVIIGFDMGKNTLKEIPKNLEIVAIKDQDFIRKYMNHTKVYCQFSIAEGVPNTVMEAILMGCYPCLTAVNGMADLHVDKILIKDEVNPEYLVKALALYNSSTSFKNRKKIEEEYSLEKRLAALMKLAKH
ncbi:MAG: glycosyltransferase family 4 protein, partial [Bacteroidetes bacterium]|nr:glycosyltransferase family 4 protein [Bacteroidota bacterium]